MSTSPACLLPASQDSREFRLPGGHQPFVEGTGAEEEEVRGLGGVRGGTWPQDKDKTMLPQGSRRAVTFPPSHPCQGPLRAWGAGLKQTLQQHRRTRPPQSPSKAASLTGRCSALRRGSQVLPGKRHLGSVHGALSEPCLTPYPSRLMGWGEHSMKTYFWSRDSDKPGTGPVANTSHHLPQAQASYKGGSVLSFRLQDQSALVSPEPPGLQRQRALCSLPWAIHRP